MLAAFTPIKVHLCKTQLSELLNKIVSIQAFHMGYDLNNIPDRGQLSKDAGENAIVSTSNDRTVIVRKFTTHIKVIFDSLGLSVQEKRFDDFF